MGVVSLHRAPLSYPSLVAAENRDLYRSARATRVTIPTGMGCVVRLFVVYGYQEAEEDSVKLALFDRLLKAVLAEVCVGQHMVTVGDFNADPGVIPCLAKVCWLVG